MTVKIKRLQEKIKANEVQHYKQMQEAVKDAEKVAERQAQLKIQKIIRKVEKLQPNKEEIEKIKAAHSEEIAVLQARNDE